jgi:predicted transcriptional regulator
MMNLEIETDIPFFKKLFWEDPEEIFLYSYTGTRQVIMEAKVKNLMRPNKLLGQITAQRRIPYWTTDVIYKSTAYTREKLSKLLSTESNPFGGYSNSVLVATSYYDEDAVRQAGEITIQNSRKIARALVDCPGALEAILMLTDVKKATVNELVEKAEIPVESFSKVLAVLYKHDLIGLKDTNICITELGKNVVNKLRSYLSNEAKSDG